MKFGKRGENRLTRWISLIITLVLVLDIMLGAGIFTPLVDFITVKAHAEDEEVEEEVLPTYTPTYTSFNAGTVYLTRITEIVDYCYLYKSNAAFGQEHQNDHVIMSLTNEPSNRDLGPN